MNEAWDRPPANMELSENHVDIWRTALDLPQQQIDEYSSILSPSELARAERFKVERKQREYIISRGLLRRVLGHVLRRDPSVFEFEYTEHDKPHLAINWHGKPVHFNISHSHERTLIAVTLNHLVGIDVEHIRGNVEFRKLARRFFSAQEERDLSIYTEAELPPVFFACWTRKEAFVKALGDGIAFGLKEFSVSENPYGQEVALATHWDPGAAESWSLINIPAGPDYMAALAVAGRNLNIRYWEY